MTEKGSRNRILMWLLVQSLGLWSVFMEAIKIFIYLYFFSKRQPEKLRTNSVCTVKKVQIWSFRPSKYYSSDELIPLNAGCVSLIRLSLLALLLLFIVGRRWMNVLNMEIKKVPQTIRNTFILHFWNYPAKIELPLSQPPPCSRSFDCSRALTQHLCLAGALFSFSQNTYLQYHPENAVKCTWAFNFPWK